MWAKPVCMYACACLYAYGDLWPMRITRLGMNNPSSYVHRQNEMASQVVQPDAPPLVVAARLGCRHRVVP